MSLYLWFTLMLVVSALWLIWFLCRPLKTSALNLEKSNIVLGRQKQAELEQDLQSDLIDKQVFEQAKNEIVQTLSIEIKQTSDTIDSTQQSVPIWLIALIVVFLFGASLFVYRSLTSQSITAQNVATMQTLQAQKPPTLAQSIVSIKKRLKEKPDDAKAWRILGLALFESDEISQSLEAYERSYQLAPKNVEMLVEYASTLATSQNNQFTGRVSTLVREALEINANSSDALYLAGWVALSVQQFDLTQKLWQKALSLLPENQPERVILQRMLNELSQTQNEDIQPAQQHQVTLNITLSKRLHQAEFQNHYLMIYVKAMRGRPMPIAIVKIKVKDFAGVVTLTDENSVMSTRKLSQSSKVLAVVRLSKSGSAIRQVGDIEAVSQVIDVRDDPAVELKL